MKEEIILDKGTTLNYNATNDNHIYTNTYMYKSKMKGQIPTLLDQ